MTWRCECLVSFNPQFTLIIIRYRHRDWYIDQGAAGPLTGVVASVSDALVKTWLSTSTYTKDLSKTLSKKSIPKENRLPTRERRVREPDRGILAGEDPRFPVQAALTYPPEHLERVAYRMAAESLPDSRKKTRQRRRYIWSPRMQMTTNATPTPSSRLHTEDHGKALEITAETGQFAYSVTRTALHGMLIRACPYLASLTQL